MDTQPLKSGDAEQLGAVVAALAELIAGERSATTAQTLTELAKPLRAMSPVTLPGSPGFEQAKAEWITRLRTCLKGSGWTAPEGGETALR